MKWYYLYIPVLVSRLLPLCPDLDWVLRVGVNQGLSGVEGQVNTQHLKNVTRLGFLTLIETLQLLMSEQSYFDIPYRAP